MKNYYEILEIPFTASANEVKEAYDRKSVQYYRDRDIATEVFFEIKEAYYTLSSSYKRVSYDKDFLVYFPHYAAPEQIEINEPGVTEDISEILPKSELQETSKLTETEIITNKRDTYVVKIETNPYSNVAAPEEINIGSEIFAEKKTETRKLETEEKIPDYTSPLWLSKKDHWGQDLAANVDFFKLPKNIGKILSVYCTLTKDKQPPDQKKTFWSCVCGISIGIGITAFLNAFLYSFEELISILWIIIPTWGCLAGYVISRFRHTVTYVGTEGLAMFKCRDSRENITQAFELHFSKVKELIRAEEIITHSHKGSQRYSKTKFTFAWLNEEDLIKEITGSHTSQSNNPSKRKTDYWLQHFAEVSWTNYLLSQMQNAIDNNEEIEFTLYGKESYVKRGSLRLGGDYITIVFPDREKTCRFDEARRIYAKDDTLYIEYMNYKKRIFFADEGNRDKISLNYLANRELFYKILEKRLG